MKPGTAKTLWIFNIALPVVAVIGVVIANMASLWPIVDDILVRVVIISLFLFPVTTFLAIWFWLAPRNYFFTFVKEGSVKIVVRGGGFEKALIQWGEHTFDAGWNVVSGQEPWHPFGGLRFYGIWPIFDIYGYWFKWSGVTEDGQVVHHPKEFIDYVLVKDDVYWAKVDEAEDQKLLPLDIELVLTIRVFNPYRAIFRVQNWLEAVVNRVKPAVRDVVTNKEYEVWVTMPEEMGEEIFNLCQTRGLLEEFIDRYGVDLRRVQVKTINPPSNYREKTLAPYLAEMDRKAVVIRADAESQRIEKVFSQIRAFGDLGQLIRSLEALEKSPEQGAKWVIPLPGGSEFLREIFGGRPVETVTQQEFAELRAMVEKVLQEKG